MEGLDVLECRHAEERQAHDSSRDGHVDAHEDEGTERDAHADLSD